MYNNKMNGYAPFRSSGSRMWGMSSSLPSGMSDYADYYPPAASSYPPPNHHYYNNHANLHHHHQQHHHNQQQQQQHHLHHHHHDQHQPLYNQHNLSSLHLPHHNYPHQQSAHNLHHNLHHNPHHNHLQQQQQQLNYLPPAHNPQYYGIPPPSPAPASQDTDFGTGTGATACGSSRRMYDIPGASMTATGTGHLNTGLGAHHLSASSTSSLSGCGLGSGGGGGVQHPGVGGGPSYNGIGGSGGTNLIINYLPQDMTDRELFSLFRTMGPIETCRIMRDFKTNYSFGYAFINFVTEEGAQRAIKCLNGVTVRNKRLKVSYARPAGEEIKETNLYVTNLPKTITEEQMDVIFGKYGLIVQKNILRDKITGKPRGVAFIRFNKREEAQEAIAALNNVIPEGGSQPLTVRIAEEHGKTKAQQLFGVGQTAGSSLNMLGGYPMPPGGGAAGHFQHQSNALHRAGLDGLYSRKKSFPYSY